MSNTSLVLICLGVISTCLVTLTAVLSLTARDLRRTLHRINAILPDASRTFHETARAVTQVRQLLTRANVAVRGVEAVVHRACDAASETLEQVALAGQRARLAFTKWVGNGAGAEPRSNGKHRK